MNDDHHDLRRISVSVIFMLAFAIAAIIARDAGFGRTGLKKAGFFLRLEGPL